jgi:hypothetical protein
MHRSLEAYSATLLTPSPVLEVPTVAARSLHVQATREIQAAKGGTYGREWYPTILPKCRLPRYI